MKETSGHVHRVVYVCLCVCWWPVLGGRTEKDDPLRTSDSAKTLSVSSVDELDTRSLVVQSSHSSYHTTDGSHDQTAILSETSTWSMVISGCARGGLRSGVGVGFDSASTMLGQPKNGDARRKSGSSSKLRPLRRPHSNGRQHSFDRIPLPFANALSVCLRTWTATRPAVRVVSPSRSGG